jgi:hypothetical protein
MRELASVLTHKFVAPRFTATASVKLNALRDGDQAGFGIAGLAPSWLGLRRVDGKPRMVMVRCGEGGPCVEEVGPTLPDFGVRLRVEVADGAHVSFSYSADGARYVPIGAPFEARMGRWVGAQLALFATGAQGAYADIEHVRITP